MTRSLIVLPHWAHCCVIALILLGTTTMASGSMRAATPTYDVDVYQATIGSNTIGPSTAGPDDNLWFIEYAPRGTGSAAIVAKIGRITPTGAVTDFALPALDRSVKPSYDESFAAITAGPDGNLWFTDAYASRIGRITPDGSIAEFPVPTPHSGLGEIAAGPDGNIWFLEEIGYTPGATGPTPLRSKIVRMTTDGSATEFETEGELRNLVAGPDGNLYVMNRGAEKLLRISPAGAISVLPTGYANAYQIIVGPDNNFWGAQWSSCRPTSCQYIYRITPAGVLTQFNAPGPPNGIARGRDGNLWYINFSNPQVGRITTMGAFTSYALLSGFGDAQFITAGSDGKLWVTTATNTIIHWDPTAIISSAASPGASTTASATPNASPTTCSPFTPNSAFAGTGFQSQWRQREAITPNFWGPTVTDGRQEPYVEAPGGQRLVQYFDKGRMELNDPATDAVTNGLLATELLTGNLQLGDQRFQQRYPSGLAIAGDLDDFTGVTYGQINGIKEIRDNVTPALGAPTTRATVLIRSIGYSRTISRYGDGANYPQATIAAYDDSTSHNVSTAFATYRDRAGLATIGYAITEPFWADVKVDGVAKHVLVQIFQRRALTYTPDNPPDYQVEMGNVGQHYYRWRYCSSQQ